MIASDVINFSNPIFIEQVFIAMIISIGAFLLICAFLNFAYNWGKW